MGVRTTTGESSVATAQIQDGVALGRSVRIEC